MQLYNERAGFGDNVDHQDAFWVERTRRGDHAAFGLLVDKYAAKITRFLAAKIGHVNETHDLAQDTWLQTYLSLDHLREPDKFREWVYGSARNRALMWLRQTRATAALQKIMPDEHTADDASSLDLIAMWKLREAVLHAITQLSEVIAKLCNCITCMTCRIARSQSGSAYQSRP